MIRGLFTAASGLSVEARRNELISNNLANVNTTGYKRDDLRVESFRGLLIRRMNDPDGRAVTASISPAIGQLGVGGLSLGSTTDYSLGSFTETGNALDLALTGDGFFVVDTPRGERYTRDGSFSRASDGYLVTAEGHRVLGQNGAIRLAGGQATVDDDGLVRVDGRTVDRLQIVRPAQGGGLEKEGGSLLRANGAVVAAPRREVQVRQGYLERSNVNVVREMVTLIAALRSYETNQKVIQTQDELLSKAVNEVGRV